MTVIELVTDIDAPIERVFDLARDLDLHAESMAHTREQAMAGRTTGLVEVGDTVTWRARHFGLWWSLTSRITAVEAPVRFEDVQERGPFGWFRHVHTFSSTGGGTRMHDRWEHVAPLGALGRLVDRLVLGRYMRALLATRNEALKRAAEASSPPSGRRLLVLYDADCGFCTRSARVLRYLDRADRLRLVALQAAAGEPDVPPIDRLLDALHVRDLDGRWTTGGAASIRIAREISVLRPFLVLTAVPGVERMIEAVYRIVARNRHRISRLLGDPACPTDRR